jgi:hypothetical protein
MRRNKGIISWVAILFWFWSAGLTAQADFRYYDQQTYEYYEQQRWDDLIPVAREALAAGYDYAYLRLRLGIAFFEQERYRQAVPHFRRALAFNPADGLTREYLYYSLLWGGQPDEARQYGGLPGADRTPLPRPAAGHLFVLGTWKISERETVVRDLWNGSVGLQHGLGRRLLLAHTLSSLQQRFVALDTVVRPGPGPGPAPTQVFEVPYGFNQQEYGLLARWSLGRGWRLAGGWGMIWSNDTEGGLRENAFQGHIIKAWPLLEWTASAGYARFDIREAWQYGGSVMVYPRGNTDLYWRSAATLQSGNSIRYWWTQQLGLRLAPRSWVSGLVEWGEIAHYQDWTQGFLYNIADPVQSRLAVNWRQDLGPDHYLLLQYMWEKKTRLETGQAYRHHALTIGLSFKLF